MEDIENVLKKASWCLNCPGKPCSLEGCPMNTKIPDFINKIKENNFEEAYKILVENNICSYICSLICPQENQCEGKCVRGIKQTSTEIGRLEQFVNEWARENNVKYIPQIAEKNGKKIAIIGSGPAGIECAYELLKNGFDVTIFEKNKHFGGLLYYGIPDFRLDKKLVEEVFEKLENMGVSLKNNTEFGKDIKLEDLQEKFDAVFIAIGAGNSSIYKLHDEDLEKIYDSSKFLKAYNDGEYINDLGDCVVIGGGNVAMDSARTAKKMGAKSVKILYRRDEANMPARKIELEDAIKDGVEFVPFTRVVSANSESNKLISLNCVKTELIDGRVKDVENSEHIVKADSVVFAIGLKPEKTVFEKENIKLNEKGMVDIDENGMTNIKNVYAGGDLVETRSTVCRALATGKKVAESIAMKINY